MERTINGLPPIHPGEYIREALDDLGITQAALAKNLGISPMRISHLVRKERPVTAELALRLGQAFGQSPQYSDFLIRMRISSQILEIDLALYFDKIGKPHRENFHF